MADQIDQLYKRAEDAFSKKNYDYARDLFRQIIAIDANYVKARKALRATVLTKFKEVGGPGKMTLMMKSGSVQAQIAMNKSKPDKLIDLCQTYLLEDPNNSKIRATLSQALLDLQKHDGASAEAEMALEADAHNIPAAKVLVTCYVHLNRIPEAQDILEKVSRHAPADRDIEKLQRDLAAKATMAKGFEDTGTKGFRAALRDAKTSGDLERASHLIKSDSDIQGQLDALEAEMGENPTDPKIPKKIGDVVAEYKKDYKAAREWYQKASNLAPQDSVLRDKVDDMTVRMHDMQIDTATKTNDPKLPEYKASRLKFQIQSFERRVHDRPTDMGLRFDLGKCYLQAGPNFLDKSIGEFQQSVKDPKKKMESHILLGQAFQKKKMYDMADGQYAKAEESGVIGQERLHIIWYNRAICLAEAGNFPKALELGKRIMEENISYKDIAARAERWQKGQT